MALGDVEVLPSLNTIRATTIARVDLNREMVYLYHWAKFHRLVYIYDKKKLYKAYQVLILLTIHIIQAKSISCFHSINSFIFQNASIF